MNRKYGPPRENFDADKWAKKYNAHKAYCHKYGYVSWDQYASKPVRIRIYGPPHGTKGETSDHRQWCMRYGFCTWEAFLERRHNKKMMRLERKEIKRLDKIESKSEWKVESPTFRRPIPEIIARINRLAEIAMRR
jgi:hypothetical protein